jgi:hypothetical protein
MPTIRILVALLAMFRIRIAVVDHLDPTGQEIATAASPAQLEPVDVRMRATIQAVLGTIRSAAKLMNHVERVEIVRVG